MLYFTGEGQAPTGNFPNGNIGDGFNSTIDQQVRFLMDLHLKCYNLE